MNIVINGEKRSVKEGLDLESLLQELELPNKRVAIELNTSVIRRKDWSETLVCEADQLEIIHFVGGG